MIPKTETVCRHCGAAKEKAAVGARVIDQEDGDLEEIDKDRVRKARKMEEWTCESLSDLITLGTKRGYRDPVKWAGFMWTSKQARKKEKSHADQQALKFYEEAIRR